VNIIGTLDYSIIIPFLFFLVEDPGGNALIYGIVGATMPAEMLPVSVAFAIFFMLPESRSCLMQQIPLRASAGNVMGQEHRECYVLAGSEKLSIRALLKMERIPLFREAAHPGRQPRFYRRTAHKVFPLLGQRLYIYTNHRAAAKPAAQEEQFMNAKQLVYAQIQHQETDPVPYTLDFEGEVDLALDNHYGSANWRERIQPAILRIPAPVPWVDESVVPRYVDPYGTIWRTDRRPHYVETVPLVEADLDRYRFPDMEVFFTAEWREQADAFIRAHSDRFLVAPFSLGLFERSWTLRGFEQALMDSAAEPEFYDALIESIAIHQMRIIERLLELPVDAIMFSDDWGYQEGVILGPEAWRRYMKPRLKRMYRLTHEGGKLAISHCCGSVADIMEDIVEIGLDGLESVQPEAMDPYELKNRYGRDICFWGGLGSQSVIQFGSPADIRAEVQRLCREMGCGGGYILAPAKALQPGTPVQNAAAVVESFLAQAGVAMG